MSLYRTRDHIRRHGMMKVVRAAESLSVQLRRRHLTFLFAEWVGPHTHSKSQTTSEPQWELFAGQRGQEGRQAGGRATRVVGLASLLAHSLVSSSPFNCLPCPSITPPSSCSSTPTSPSLHKVGSAFRIFRQCVCFFSIVASERAQWRTVSLGCLEAAEG